MDFNPVASLALFTTSGTSPFASEALNLSGSMAIHSYSNIVADTGRYR